MERAKVTLPVTFDDEPIRRIVSQVANSQVHPRALRPAARQVLARNQSVVESDVDRWTMNVRVVARVERDSQASTRTKLPESGNWK